MKLDFDMNRNEDYNRCVFRVYSIESRCSVFVVWLDLIITFLFLSYQQELYVEEDNVFRPHVERVFPTERGFCHGAVFQSRGQYGRNCDGAL